jgi:hypothetical protein
MSDGVDASDGGIDESVAIWSWCFRGSGDRNLPVALLKRPQLPLRSSARSPHQGRTAVMANRSTS